MKKSITMPELDIVIPPGVSSGDGFFCCEHCHSVVDLSQREVDAAQNAPAGSLMKLKCPNCHRWAVRWRVPSPLKPRRTEKPPVSFERGQELFANLKQKLAA